jgi:hypothetical protein
LNNKETRTLENSNRHIDKWLNQQFEDFTPNPDAGLWQSIDAALDRKERRSKFIWYWLAAGVLLSVLSVAAVQWSLKNTNQSAKPTVAQIQTESPAESTASNQKASPSSENPSVSNTEALNKSARVLRKATSTDHLNRALEQSVSNAVDDLQVADRDAYETDARTKDFIAQWSTQTDDATADQIVTLGPLPWSKGLRKPLMPGRWTVEVGADANQTGLMYRAKSDYGNYIHKNYFDRMKTGEFALSASRIQAGLLFQLSAKHSVKLGLAYAENRTQQRFDFRDSMPATVIQGQTSDALGYYPIFGYLGLGPQVSFQSQNTYTMLSIPMGYTGHFPWKKGLSITPEILVSANRLGISAGAQTLDYQTLLQKAQSSEQFRAWVMGLRLAVGVEKRLNYSHAIGLRLNAQSMLSPMYVPNAALESRGWSAGLSAHYSWRIQ